MICKILETEFSIYIARVLNLLPKTVQYQIDLNGPTTLLTFKIYMLLNLLRKLLKIPLTRV